MSKLRTHYDNLKVARDAPDMVIRAAYKSLTQNYHPDKNPGDARAAQIMALINQSYDVLSDPVRRREHDEWIAREELRLKEASSRQTAPQSPPIPPQWEQPQPQAPQKTKPWRRVLANILRLLWAFARRIFAAAPGLVSLVLVFGGLWLWGALTPATPPPSGPKPYQAEAPANTSLPDPMPYAASNPTDGSESQAVQSLSSKPYESDQPTQTRIVCKEFSNVNVKGRLMPLFKCIYPDDSGTVHYSNYVPKGAITEVQGASQVQERQSGPYAKPETAPNGSAWPIKAGYVKGYPIDNHSGYSKVTVDNGKNDSDVFVKLVSLDGPKAYPVRQFYIPAGSSFTMNKVTAGQYDVRYRDLDTGGLSRSESFELTETKDAEGVHYDSYTMTLYKVANGNLQTFDLAESEF